MSNSIDSLTAMDVAIHGVQRCKGVARDDLRKARVAVAELIEACKSLQQHPDDLEIQADFSRALDRVRGAA